jgi:hypothetical protein
MAVWLILPYVKDISQKTRESRVKNFIGRLKFLSNPRYFKTNKVSSAHWESSAAQGKAGGCYLCPANYYIYTFHNKRYTTTNQSYKGKEFYWQNIGGKLCDTCYYEIEKQCNYKFDKW